MTPLDLLRAALRGKHPPWDAEKDPTMRYLRTQRLLAERETRRLMRQQSRYFPMVDYVRLQDAPTNPYD